MKTRDGSIRGDRPVRAGRNPFQLWIVLACTVTGLVALLPIGPARRSAVDQFLPEFATLWYAGLLVSGTVCIVAVMLPARTLPRLSRLLGLERVGLALLAGLLVGYGAALLVAAPKMPVGFLLVALAVACVGRLRQVRNEVRSLQSLVRALRRDHDTHLGSRDERRTDLPPTD